MDRAFDHPFFVKRGNEHRDQSIRIDGRNRSSSVFLGIDQSESSQNQRSSDAQRQRDCEQKTEHDNCEIEQVEQREVGLSCHTVCGGQHRHRLRARQASEARHWNEVITARGQLIDDDRQRGDRLAAISA